MDNIVVVNLLVSNERNFVYSLDLRIAESRIKGSMILSTKLQYRMSLQKWELSEDSNFKNRSKELSLCHKLWFSLYLQLWTLLDQTIQAYNIKSLHHQVAEKKGLKYLSLWQRLWLYFVLYLCQFSKYKKVVSLLTLLSVRKKNYFHEELIIFTCCLNFK